MTAYYFRVVKKEKPNGWVGFVMAPTLQHLFWAIDEFVDPYAVEIQTAKIAGYCFHLELGGQEFSEHEPSWDIGKWKKPIWVTDKNFDTTV